MNKLLMGAVFALPLAVGWATSQTASSVAAHAPSLACAGGAEDPIDVSFEIVAAKSTDRGERLLVHAAVHNHFDAAARTIMAHEVVTDRGVVIRERKKSRIETTDADGHRVEQLQTPDALEPGFYEMRVSAAGVIDESGEDSLAVKSMFFEVTKHGTLPISHDEFMKRSNAGLAFFKPGSDEEMLEEVKR